MRGKWQAFLQGQILASPGLCTALQPQGSVWGNWGSQLGSLAAGRRSPSSHVEV